MKPVLSSEPMQADFDPCKTHKENFETMLRAAADGNLALLECELAATGEKVAAIVAVNTDKRGEPCDIVPFAIFINGNPYELLNPPHPDGGFVK